MGFLSAIRRLRTDRDGVSAIEFALIAPVVLLILAAVVDFGALIYTRTRLEIAISAATSYAMAAGQDLSSANAPALATDAARIVVGQMGTAVDLTLTLNRDLVTHYHLDALQQSGSTGAASLCFCPEIEAATLDWGQPTSCQARCPDGGSAGKFLAVKATLPHSPLFFGYGLMTPEGISVETVVALQ